MDKPNKIQEIETDFTTYNKIKGKLSPQEKQSTQITGDKPAPVGATSNTSNTSAASTAVSPISVTEEFPPVQQTDMGSIKYLSNVKDGKTGEISQPFTIGAKRYQMVRGLDQSQKVVMGVYCHDDLNEGGENVIHPVDHFEKNIAQPMKEKEEMVGQDIQVAQPQAQPKVHPVAAAMNLKPSPSAASNLSEFKHFVMNNKTGKVRKFRKIEELAKANMTEDETYMNLPQFKKHVSEKLFGSRGSVLKELAPTGDEDAAQMSIKANKLMGMIKTGLSSQVTSIMKTIKTPVAQGEVVAAFAQLIGLDKHQLKTVVSQLKDTPEVPQQPQAPDAPATAPAAAAPASVSEGKKVIRVLKVKEIDNERL